MKLNDACRDIQNLRRGTPNVWVVFPQTKFKGAEKKIIYLDRHQEMLHIV